MSPFLQVMVEVVVFLIIFYLVPGVVFTAALLWWRNR